MKTHKIKHGGDFTVIGYDDTFRTYCGITEECSEDMHGNFVDRNEDCSCKKCKELYDKELEEFDS